MAKSDTASGENSQFRHAQQSVSGSEGFQTQATSRSFFV